MFLWDKTASPSSVSVPITLTRQSSSTNISDLRLFNSLSDFEQNYGTVHLSVCDAIESSQYTFYWEILHENVKQKTITTRNCSTTVSGLHSRTYGAYLSIRDSNETVVKIGFLRFSLNPLWVAVLGDSFASGEGNPDEGKKDGHLATWIDERCHRSRNSFAVLAFEFLALTHPRSATYLTFLACAGASADKGILKDETRSSQIDVIEDIARKRLVRMAREQVTAKMRNLLKMETNFRGKGPDIVILTMGGNDIGFSDILNSLGHGYPSHDDSLIDMR
uniref:SGNH_hydro domain-containing protein n=1 Tax=Heterorhabditis bacteriophora TaxID=37862 RepID=A0A1I7XLW0_HETBA